MGHILSCYRHYFLISDQKLPPIWQKFSQRYAPLFSASSDRVTRRRWRLWVGDANGTRSTHYVETVRKACHRQIIRREARRSAALPTVSILRSLPTLRTIWFIHRCWLQLILVPGAGEPGQRTSRRFIVARVSFSFLFPSYAMYYLASSPHVTCRANERWFFEFRTFKKFANIVSLEYRNSSTLNSQYCSRVCFIVEVLIQLSRRVWDYAVWNIYRYFF